MNKWLKYTSLAFIGAVFAVLMGCSFMAGRSLRAGCLCERLEVVITDSLENHFVSANDVRMFLDRGYGRYIGVPIDSIDLAKVEDIISRRSAVRETRAYTTKDGVLHADITQRRPVVRFQKKDGGFYADAQGYIFPLQSSYASHVQVIDGHIPLAATSGYKGELASQEEKKWFSEIMTLVNYMEGDPDLKDMIVQIHVKENGDLVLIPRKGNERFIFGQPRSLEDKFMRMRKYYTAVIPEKGAGKYSVVDLRFKGQIVCR